MDDIEKDYLKGMIIAVIITLLIFSVYLIRW